MARSLSLFTGQWADLPLAKLAPLAKTMGYDALELACWGDHFDVDAAVASRTYRREKWALLADHGLTCHALSNHLVGQAVCDLIDERHRAILPRDVWGEGDPEKVRRRAAKKLIVTAKAARAFFDDCPEGRRRRAVPIVNGFTGSSVWHSVYAFPPVSPSYWDAGFDDFAARFGPILEVFDAVGVNFALEVHPTEIAFDTVSAERAVRAVKQHRRFGFNYDPSHFGYQGVDYVGFIHRLAQRIFHVHVKDVWWGHGDGTVGVYGGHTRFGDSRRAWNFRSPGRGDIRFEEIIVALNAVGYRGPLSVEWEEAAMDRVQGATEAAAFVRRLDFEPSATAFDAAFVRKSQKGTAHGR
jgi:sugar phosphate isomerase/epimerase